MQVAKPLTRLPATGRLGEVAKLISDYLCNDCVLRIEHTPRVVDQYVQWQQWGPTFYALKDALVVIKEIVACRNRYPKHTIRLYAERLRPQSRLVFWV